MRFVAGRGAVAESHREDAAGRGRRSGRDTAGRGADAEVFLAVGAVAKSHREDVAGWGAVEEHGRPYHREESLRPKAR